LLSESKGFCYFPGLNGLRFVAAALVMMAHIEQLKKDESLPNLDAWPIFGQSGQNGVTLFFVLSGFLITYLLLEEDRLTGRIHIRNFYIRRILRIWPLYYLIVALGFFVLPWCIQVSGLENALKTGYWPKLGLFLLFLPNLAMVSYPQVPFTAQAWSVGTEEQFYLIWPWLLRKFKHMLPAMLLCITVGIVLVRKGLFIWRDHLPDGSVKPVVSLVAEFLNTFTIECMAIGGLGAWVLFQKKQKLLNVLFHPLTQVLVFALLIFSLSTGLAGHVKSRNLVNSVLFICLILNLAANNRSLIRLESRFFRFMGSISYGLYMFHPLCFYLGYLAFHDFLYTGSGWASNGLLYLFVFVSTTALSWLSYRLLEKPFLRLKKKFSLLDSGEREMDKPEGA
jgi:peptidoglycan/LPS O-acetylase OafA/YrhL